MKISSLELKAFGPFTNRTLDFGKQPGGMTVILGPNEAGKSSALRAIRGVLYGIPRQTEDNFLHANQKLRIGIELLDQQGEVRAFVRRKGSKDTLLSVSGEPIDERSLKPIYHSIPESLFNSLFGITHRDLTLGGEDILNQQGELGQALFSVSSARKNLQQTLKALDESANSLFTPRGQKQAINAGLRDYAALKKQLSEAALNVDDWARLQESFENTAERLEALSSEIKINDIKLNELQRSERLLPKIATRLQLQSEIAALGNVKQLNDNFALRRQAAVEALILAKNTEEGLVARRDDLATQIKQAKVDDNLLSLETILQTLYQSLESYTRAVGQLPVLTLKQEHIEDDLDSQLNSIQPGLKPVNIDRLSVVLSREAQIKPAVSRYQSLQMEKTQASTSVFSYEQKLLTLAAEKVAPIDDAALLRAQKDLQYGQQYSALESDLREYRAKIVEMESHIQTAIAALPYWNGKLAGLQSLPVPGAQTLKSFNIKFIAVEQKIKQISIELSRLDSEQQLVLNKLKGLQSGTELPSKQELEDVRRSRNNAWSLLKNQWLDGIDVTLEAGSLDSQRKLPEAFELRLHKADDIADRLRIDSDRVAHHESLLGDGKRLEKQQYALSSQLHDAKSEQSILVESWLNEWKPCDITPHAPEEMLEWRNAREEILRLADAMAEHQYKIDTLTAAKEAYFSRVMAAPCSISIDENDSLNSLLSKIGIWIETTQKASQAHSRYVESIQRLEKEHLVSRDALALNEKSLQKWQSNWLNLVEGSGLESNAEPDSALERLQQIRNVFTTHAESRELKNTTQSLRREIQTFDTLHDELKIDSGILSKQQHVPELYKLLSLQKQEEAVRIKNKDELRKLTSALDQARRDRETSELLMHNLLAEADCSSQSQLPELEQRSAEFSRLKQQLIAVEKEILNDGGGKSINEIVLSVKGLDAATLSAEINQTRQLIEFELEPLKQRLSEDRGSKRKELESMLGSAEVALMAEQAEQALVKIRRHVSEYMQLKTAAKLLRDEMERFRKKNQAPLLKIAGQYFSELTIGAFVGLGSDFNENDNVILIAERKSGEKIPVEAMSSGTRDQLYLALRLAAFERSIERRGPMPLIVDDILIEFDDERSHAALEIFSRLSKKTQIILFSHHPRIGELSKILSNPPDIIAL